MFYLIGAVGGDSRCLRRGYIHGRQQIEVGLEPWEVTVGV